MEEELMKTDAERLFGELRRLSPKVTGGLLRMRQEAYREGAVPAKYKLLAALALSVAIRCEPCIRAYVEMAHEKGITQAELIEFLEVAMTMQGCPGEEWRSKPMRLTKSVSVAMGKSPLLPVARIEPF